eukprot:1196390-Prorocentrum_minimum.AAC.14
MCSSAVCGPAFLVGLLAVLTFRRSPIHAWRFSPVMSCAHITGLAVTGHLPGYEQFMPSFTSFPNLSSGGPTCEIAPPLSQMYRKWPAPDPRRRLRGGFAAASEVRSAS